MWEAMGLDGESRSGQCGAGGHKIRRVEQMLEGQWEASWRAHLARWLVCQGGQVWVLVLLLPRGLISAVVQDAVNRHHSLSQ